MALHLFVDSKNNTLIHAFKGDETEAERFMTHKRETGNPIIHIRVENEKVTVGDD